MNDNGIFNTVFQEVQRFAKKYRFLPRTLYVGHREMILMIESTEQYYGLTGINRLHTFEGLNVVAVDKTDYLKAGE